MSLLGRGARFFAVAAICKKWGARGEAFLLKQISGSAGRDQVSFIFILALCILGGAFFFEYVRGLQPCQLCLWQRIPYYFVLAITFISLFLFSEKIYYWVLVLCGVAFFASALLGGYHVGIEFGLWQGFTQCSGGAPLALTPQELIAQLQTAEPLDCAQPQWQLFGLSLAGYNMILSLGLAAFIIWKLQWANSK